MVNTTRDDEGKTTISTIPCMSGNNTGKTLIMINSNDEEAGIYLTRPQLEEHKRAVELALAEIDKI